MASCSPRLRYRRKRETGATRAAATDGDQIPTVVRTLQRQRSCGLSDFRLDLVLTTPVGCPRFSALDHWPEPSGGPVDWGAKEDVSDDEDVACPSGGHRSEMFESSEEPVSR